MLPGPVFNFELMATARRSRFYLIRAFYAAILFVILWGVHSAWTSETGGELPSKMVSWFAFSTFCGITIGQEILVLVLTPALVAGVIADEKQRKTLHYLMASRLSSAEIVLGKLLVRMLYVTVLLGVSLPVLSLLVLLGGIDPLLVLLSCGATLSTGWFLASLSIWVSTIARRVREAFFIAFGLECLWLFSSLILRNISIPAWPAFDQATHWLAEWVGASSPIEVAYDLFRSLYTVILSGGARTSEVELVAWMMGLQLGFGSVLALLASWQLRPIFRRQDAGGGIRAIRGLFRTRKSQMRHAAARHGSIQLSRDSEVGPFLRTRWRFRLRPALGNHPMLWKELYTDRPRGLAQFVGLLLTVTAGGFLAYYTYWVAEAAIREVWESGNAPRNDYTAWANRNAFMWFLLGVVPLIYVIGILGVAGAAAASITSEHEEDTWVSLTATDLTGREIIFAKMFGSTKRGLKFAGLIVFLATLGALVGSISPLSIPLLILAMGIYACAAAALGLSISLHLRSTWRAQFLTMASLLLINVFGQGVLNLLSRFGFAPQLWPGFSPYEISKLLLDSQYIEHLLVTEWPYSWRVSAMDDGLAWRTIFSITSLVAYTTMTAFLLWYALHRFEVVVGRARRSTTPPPPTPNAIPASKEPQLIA
jgi:ABC-type transport system involved in multi-copper enzyme maturation permease subunit